MVLRIPLRVKSAFAYRAITFFGRVFQLVQLALLIGNSTHAVLQPHSAIALLNWFRLFPFRSPLLWKSLLFSFPPGTEMVHFPGFALTPL